MIPIDCPPPPMRRTDSFRSCFPEEYEKHIQNFNKYKILKKCFRILRNYKYKC